MSVMIQYIIFFMRQITSTYCLADYFFQLLNDKEKPAETEEQSKKVEYNKKSLPKSKVRKILFPGILLYFSQWNLLTYIIIVKFNMDAKQFRAKPHFWEAGVAQWWERSPPTNVSRVQFPGPASYVGLVCCWFSSLLPEVFMRVLRFSPQLKSQHFQISILACKSVPN